MAPISPFRFIEPGQAVPSSDITAAVLASRPGCSQSVVDAVNLADSAAEFFRGVFPVESPYFSYGEGVWLPWSAEYWSLGSDGCSRIPMAIGEEVAFIAQQLSQVGEAQSEFDPSERLTYLSPELCATPKSRVQGLAVEGMLAADRFLYLSFEGCAIESLKHLSAAYKCIVECVCQSLKVLYPSATPDGAAALDRISNAHARPRGRVQ